MDESFMPTLTIKGLSIETYKLLKNRAKRNGRSLNKELIACIESVVKSTPAEVDQTLLKIQNFRKNLKLFVTEEEVNKYKRMGRL